MLYTLFNVGNKEYKLRLTTKNIVTLEKLIGCNPLMIFGINGERIPTITEMVNILYISLQSLEHGITQNDAFDIFDEYLEEHTVTDFIPIILEVYKTCGIIQKDKPEKN